MKNRDEQHKITANHINRIIGQLTALEETINHKSSCIEISNQTYSIMQSMKGLSKKMFTESLQNSIIGQDLDESKLTKLDKLLRLIS